MIIFIIVASLMTGGLLSTIEPSKPQQTTVIRVKALVPVEAMVPIKITVGQ